MDRETIFVDTWGWMALGHRREPRHMEVKRIYQELRNNQVPVYTSDYVLDEVITLLFRRETFEEAVRFVEGILAAAALGQVRIERVTPDRFFAAWDLRERFQDKPTISFRWAPASLMTFRNEEGRLDGEAGTGGKRSFTPPKGL